EKGWAFLRSSGASLSQFYFKPQLLSAPPLLVRLNSSIRIAFWVTYVGNKCQIFRNNTLLRPMAQSTVADCATLYGIYYCQCVDVRLFSVGRFELDYARTFDFRADKVLESLTNSLKRLKLTYVDVCFIQIHDADFAPQENIILYETLQALEMARHSGKIRYIGLTGYELRKLASIIDCSTVKIDVVLTYCHGSMNDNSLGKFTFSLQNRGIGVLNGSPLSMGLLTERGPPPWHPAANFIKEACLAATHYCMSKNVSISKLALAYALELPACSSCVVGMDSIQQVRDNIALCTTSPLTDLEQRVRDRIMRRYFDRLENAGWGGMDVAAYWQRLKKLGLTALATHR
ncbi:unnamed protein product, partial [Nippostrongylus brasiliensis]|uniref:Aldo_ket_red domain-containing protein n=1 Tax=Nippostrongylus brasiliensis TaxID=27835 RepID=A0A0N4XHU4_NIPBR